MLRLQRRRFFPEIVVLNHLRYSVPRGMARLSGLGW